MPRTRRHVAAQARVATALISAGGFVGIVVGQAVTSSSPASAATAPSVTSPSGVSAGTASQAPADDEPSTTYAGVPAPSAPRQPVVFSRGS